MKVILLVVAGVLFTAGIGFFAFFGAVALSGDEKIARPLKLSVGGNVAESEDAEVNQGSGTDGDAATKPRFIGGEMRLSVAGPDGAVSATIKTVASPDLPDEDPVTVGLFIRSEDNTLVLGTGPLRLELDVQVIDDGPPMPVLSIQNFGPDIEVVVPVGAVIYKDVTVTPNIMSGDLKPGDNIIQQQLKVISDLSDIPNNTIISVWGDKRGDRVVADVLVLKTETGGF